MILQATDNSFVRKILTGTLIGLLAVLSLEAAEPVFPYGAVYFRKSNPPAEDWERDHKTAARVGMNAFRHWFGGRCPPGL